MNTEKQHLLHDVLNEAPDAHRDATLLAAGRLLRRRRKRRTLLPGVALVMLLAASLFFLQRKPEPAREPRVITSAPAPPVQRQELSDDELLALFPDTPVGLVSMGDGTKRLIFPRPGDAERFITRM